MHPKVDEYLSNVGKWQKELTRLRAIVAKCGLEEEYKWMHPCYTLKKNNVLLIHEFKNYCALLFHKGALLNDAEGILVQQTENVQSARQIRFTDISEIEKLEPTIKAYIFEAIEVEKAGLSVETKKTVEFSVPEELELKFEKDPDFKAAFENLTPGRQRGYLLHFSQPKQSKTRESRIEKNTMRILNGKGLNDCICGHSKKMPNCDGSHKYI
ncbi:DUF1801 domain-containing protein [Limibacter armeniacum]|uniref:DUF1801 domain-containing protein n=1 Tax=Limibacter armeniacum TaxID=466084 RepID=UPI002FE56E12